MCVSVILPMAKCDLRPSVLCFLPLCCCQTCQDGGSTQSMVAGSEKREGRVCLGTHLGKPMSHWKYPILHILNLPHSADSSWGCCAATTSGRRGGITLPGRSSRQATSHCPFPPKGHTTLVPAFQVKRKRPTRWCCWGCSTVGCHCISGPDKAHSARRYTKDGNKESQRSMWCKPGRVKSVPAWQSRDCVVDRVLVVDEDICTE